MWRVPRHPHLQRRGVVSPLAFVLSRNVSYLDKQESLSYLISRMRVYHQGMRKTSQPSAALSQTNHSFHSPSPNMSYSQRSSWWSFQRRPTCLRNRGIGGRSLLRHAVAQPLLTPRGRQVQCFKRQKERKAP